MARSVLFKAHFENDFPGVIIEVDVVLALHRPHSVGAGEEDDLPSRRRFPYGGFRGFEKLLDATLPDVLPEAGFLSPICPGF